jgi:hypothetical protein
LPQARLRGILGVVPFPALNASAVIQCAHGGKVNVVPKQTTVLIGGSPALRLTDVPTSPIVCAVPPSPSSKPCTMVAVPPASWAVSTVLVGGVPLLSQMPGPSGLTDGVPPGPIMCTFAGQATVMA